MGIWASSSEAMDGEVRRRRYPNSFGNTVIVAGKLLEILGLGVGENIIFVGAGDEDIIVAEELDEDWFIGVGDWFKSDEIGEGVIDTGLVG